MTSQFSRVAEGRHTHSDLNGQNVFHSTIDVPPGEQGMSKYPDNQTEVHSGELER